MNCPNCGAYISEEDLFCGECGRPVDQPAPALKRLRPQDVKDQPTQVLDTTPSAPPKPASPPAAPPARGPAPAASGPSSRGLALGLVGTIAGLLCLCIAGIVIWLAMDGRASPTPTVVAVNPAPGMVIYEDDFEDPDSGWDVYNYGDTLALYQGGEYRLGVFRADYVAWGNPEASSALGDLTMEVDARAVEGPLDNNFGLLVRYQEDDEGFYWFQISSDGFFAVDRLDGDEWITISQWQESDAIEQGLGATNRLRLTCLGEQFDFYVNDVWLTTVGDDALATGGIGLAVGTFDEPGVVVHFDNLHVYGPGK